MSALGRDFSTSQRELDEKLELLQQLCIRDDTDRWIEDEYSWAMQEASDSSALLYENEEENMEACDASLYDPSLFSSPLSLSHTFAGVHRLQGVNREKPLPPPPHASSRPYRSDQAPPSTPRLTSSPSSSPPSSPRSSAFTTSTPPSPRSPFLPARSRPPSASASPSRPTHTTYPSISSTLSILEERETTAEKRSALYVMEVDQDAEETNSGENTVLAHPHMRASSFEAEKAAESISGHTMHRGVKSSPKRSIRPALPSLNTSASTPQLRTLAALAAISPLPISTPFPSAFASTPRATQHREQSFEVPGLLPSPFPAEAPVGAADDAPCLSSRWSIESTRPDVHARATTPQGSPKADDTPPSPVRQRKRDRLMSFISRSRAGSLVKPVAPPPPTPQGTSEFGVSPRETRFSKMPSSSTLSLPLPPQSGVSTPYPPVPASSSASSSSTSSPATSNSSSASTLPTPIDAGFVYPDPVVADPFSATSPTHEPSSYFPDTVEDETPSSPPLLPTLPLPSPSVPSPSFFLPARPTSSIPFLSALAIRKMRKRKKTLVISGAPFLENKSLPIGPCDDERARMEVEMREREQKRRFDSVVRWCEGFGEVKHIDRKPDGSLHVSWKNWQVADMVCRVQAQVYIKEVGRVNLAWHYTK